MDGEREGRALSAPRRPGLGAPIARGGDGGSREATSGATLLGGGAEARRALRRDVATRRELAPGLPSRGAGKRRSQPGPGRTSLALGRRT